MKITRRSLRKLIIEAVAQNTFKSNEQYDVVRQNIAEQIVAQAQTAFGIDLSSDDDVVKDLTGQILRHSYNDLKAGEFTQNVIEDLYNKIDSGYYNSIILSKIEKPSFMLKQSNTVEISKEEKEAYDILYKYLEDHKGDESTYTFEQLKEIVNDTRDYDEEPIPDAAIKAAIDDHTEDPGSGARLIWVDENKWKAAGHWGY